MKSSLYTCIQDIQNGDREQALALLEKFSPLLKKYAFFMQSEDALPDFQCFLLAFAKNLQLDKLTMSTDGAIISYINKAIYHHYIISHFLKRNAISFPLFRLKAKLTMILCSLTLRSANPIHTITSCCSILNVR